MFFIILLWHPAINYTTTTAHVTWYNNASSCHNQDKSGKCIMANGKATHEGAVACPREIKLGTKVEINGKKYICSDRTAKKLNGRFDIWSSENTKTLLKRGKQKMEIKIFK
jgi:3D (Asp-Asp-Asp) domain-containing protein